MRATGYLLSCLAAEGVGHVFLGPAGLVDPLGAEWMGTPGVTPVVAAHASGAAAMADGYARASGRFGACIALGGSGPADVVAAVATARVDASPVLFVTGRISTDAAGDRNLSRRPPPSMAGVSLLAPVAAVSVAVDDPFRMPGGLRACLTGMLAGPRAPVHVRLSPSLWRADVPASWEALDETLYRPRFVDGVAVERLWRILVPKAGGGAPTRVAVLAGAGVAKSGATEALVAFAEQFEVPVATTLRGKGVFPEDHRLSLGVFGCGDWARAVETLLAGQVEVLVVLGSGLSGCDPFFVNAPMPSLSALAQVDVDPAAIGRTFHAHVPIVGDCRAALARMMEGGSARIMRFRAGNESRAAWLRAMQAAGLASGVPDDAGCSPAAPVVAAVRGILPRSGAAVVDAGPHLDAFVRYFKAYGPQTFYAATGLGPVGWAVAAAVGVKAALPNRPVVCVTDAAGMLAHGMEVATAARLGLGIVYVVLNRLDGRDGAASEPDFAAFGRSMGARGVTATPETVGAALAEGLAGPGTLVIDVR
jgi:acetolactate synthase-1/2/3 large subunit